MDDTMLAMIRVAYYQQKERRNRRFLAKARQFKKSRRLYAQLGRQYNPPYSPRNKNRDFDDTSITFYKKISVSRNAARYRFYKKVSNRIVRAKQYSKNEERFTISNGGAYRKQFDYDWAVN